MNDHKINTNTSPIDFRLFDVDDMNIYSEETLQILTEKSSEQEIISELMKHK